LTLQTKLKSAPIEVATGKVVAFRSPAKLRCSALGSCVAVVLYDAKNNIGGIAHVMLPSTDHYHYGDDPLKFADYAIDALIHNITALLSNKNCNLKAYLIGGAMVIPDAIDVGSQNILAIKQKLKKEGIPIAGEKLGGKVRRKVFFDLETGIVRYSENGNPEKVL